MVINSMQVTQRDFRDSSFLACGAGLPVWYGCFLGPRGPLVLPLDHLYMGYMPCESSED